MLKFVFLLLFIFQFSFLFALSERPDFLKEESGSQESPVVDTMNIDEKGADTQGVLNNSDDGLGDTEEGLLNSEETMNIVLNKEYRDIFKKYQQLLKQKNFIKAYE